MQELAERISHWGRENQEKEVYEHRTETQCLQKVFLILIFKTKKKTTAEELTDVSFCL